MTDDTTQDRCPTCDYLLMDSMECSCCGAVAVCVMDAGLYCETFCDHHGVRDPRRDEE